MRPGNDATTVKVLYGTAYLAPSPYQAYAHYGSFYSDDGGADLPVRVLAPAEPGPEAAAEENLRSQRAAGHRLNRSPSPFRRFTRALPTLIQESDPDHGARRASTRAGRFATSISRSTKATSRRFGATLGADVARTVRLGHPHQRARLGQPSSTAARSMQDVSTEAIVFSRLGGMCAGAVPVRRGYPRRRTGAWRREWRSPVRQRLRALQPSPHRGRRAQDARRVYHRRFSPPGARYVSRTSICSSRSKTLLDARYRNINMRAYLNPEELIGAPQNPEAADDRRTDTGSSERLGPTARRSQTMTFAASRCVPRCSRSADLVLRRIGARSRAAQDDGSARRSVKAAFLFNVVKFVQWPPSDVPSDTVVIGLVAQRLLPPHARGPRERQDGERPRHCRA